MALLDGAARWGVGQLYIASQQRVLRLRAWPNPGAWAGTEPKSCRTPLETRVGMEDFVREVRRRDGEESRAFESFLGTLPAPVRNAVDPFAEHLFDVLQLIWSARVPAMELLETNPALTLAVALSPKLKTKLGSDGWKSPDELIRLKRGDILKWLEFPGGKSTVKILGRLTRHALSLPHLRTLRRLLIENDGTTRKRLNHLERINPEVLALLCEPRLAAQLTPEFLEDVSQMQCYEPFSAQRLADILARWPEVRPDEPPPVFRRVDDLEPLERQLWKEGVRLRLQSVRAGMRLPDPPVPGNGNIVPLDSATELFKEGHRQKNCAASYFQRVKLGQYYLYRIEKPERCTLALVKCPDGIWSLCEIKTTYNRDVQSPATMRVVMRWLKDNGCRARVFA